MYNRFKIITEFEGKINNITIKDKQIYLATKYLIDLLDTYKITYTAKLIPYLIDMVKITFTIFGKHYSIYHLENELAQCIEQLKEKNQHVTIDMIQFSIHGENWRFKDINKRLRDRHFNQ